MSSLKNKWVEHFYLNDQKLVLFFIIFSLVGSAIIGFLTPQYIKDLYESYNTPGATEKAVYLVMALFIGEYIVSFIYQVAINRYVQKLLSFIRSRSYKEWMLSIESGGGKYHSEQKYPMGEVLSRILTDTEAVTEMVSSGSFRIFIDFTFILSCLIGFVKLNTIAGAGLIIAEVLACILLILGSKKMADVYMEVRKSTGIMSRVIANLSGGFRFTFFHPHLNYASKKGYDSFEDFVQKQLKANIWDAGYFSLAESLFPILLALLVVIFPYSQITELAILAAIVDLIQRSIGPIKEVTGKISSIQRARTGIVRIEEFNRDLDKMPKTDFQNKNNKIELEKLEFSISKFQYPSKKNGKDPGKDFSLENIFINAAAGQLIGIVGQSGCGKSTLLKLLATTIISDSAKINIYCKDKKILHFSGLNQQDLLAYKSQVSIVSQDSHVFSASIQFNISLSYQDQPHFHNFWEKVKKEIPYVQHWGVEAISIVNPKELSLGQKQLLSALRSCYLTKPIVLFDEISSGLDSELEEALRKLVLWIQQYSLTFIVAHRIETIIHADQIFVLSNGKVVDQGRHKELMSSSASYQEFIAQLSSSD